IFVSRHCWDSASEDLAQIYECPSWYGRRKVTIDFCKTRKDTVEVYLQLELENVLITDYASSGEYNCLIRARPMEYLVLHFTGIKYNQAPVTNKATHALLDLVMRQAAATA